MPSSSSRMKKINEEVFRHLAVLIRQVKDPRLQNIMLSVLSCDVTNDLRWCRVYVSILGDYDEKEVKQGLKSASGFLRSELAKSVRLRYTPELLFIIDDHIAYGAHISEILNRLDIKPEAESDAESSEVSKG